METTSGVNPDEFLLQTAQDRDSTTQRLNKLSPEDFNQLIDLLAANMDNKNFSNLLTVSVTLIDHVTSQNADKLCAILKHLLMSSSPYGDKYKIMTILKLPILIEKAGITNETAELFDPTSMRYTNQLGYAFNDMFKSLPDETRDKIIEKIAAL
jgi:hypothetical protein